MELEQVFHMKGGEDNSSYARNSSLPKLAMMKVKHILEQSIQEFCQNNITPTTKCLKVVDIGCGSGSNTLLAVEQIMENIDKECHILNRELPSIQVFLNDLVNNDFNTIFKSLPTLHEKLEKNGRPFGSCFIAAMPGSSYSGLFPENSINFIHSSFCLHWLSQVPSGLMSETGLPLNKGNVCVAKTSPPSVHDAYLDQFDKDFSNFLRLRNRELVSQGQMFLTLLCNNNDQSDGYQNYDILCMTLKDMVMEGLVEEKKLDTFNLPRYRPSLEELKHIIEKEGSFKIRHLETFELRWIDAVADSEVNVNATTELIARTIRAVYESIVIAYFGDGISDDFFKRFAKKISDCKEKIVGTTKILVVSLSKM